MNDEWKHTMANFRDTVRLQARARAARSQAISARCYKLRAQHARLRYKLDSDVLKDAAPDLYFALAQIIEACHTTEYRDPLTHAQISDIANFALLKARGLDHYANLADGAPFADPEVE